MQAQEQQNCSLKKKHDTDDMNDKLESNKKSPDIEEQKPRIVLTFRSEKPGAKSSNMKIVSTEEKCEEVSPRRSNRTRIVKYDSDDDNELIKKDKNVSETDEASDSSHTTPKRNTSRRCRESDNVLANAIARKKKRYYDPPSLAQRPPRRIKPPSKVLANKESAESQNLEHLTAEKSPEEGVRTRRSARRKSVDSSTVIDLIDADKKGSKLTHESAQDDDVQLIKEEPANPTNVKKLKHLCELGLKAVSPGNENDEGELEEYEVTEDDEGDDDTEVISKLIEADADSFTSEDESDDDYVLSSASKKKQPTTRRTTRQCSSFIGNEDDRSSPINGEDDDNKSHLRRSSRKPRTESMFDNWLTEGGGGEEGSEATCPDEESGGIIATCYCETPSNIYAAPSELTEPVFCQSIEMVDSIRVGCSHGAMKEAGGGAYAPLVRAGPRAPYFMACKLHRMQLNKHMCCPACGVFCTQGFFYQCSLGHLFHLECGLPYNDTKLRPGLGPGCPHCGVHAYRWEPVNRQCCKVKLQMRCSNKRIFLPDQRVQCTPAHLGFSTLKPSQLDQTPIIPGDLLPTLPIDLTKLLEDSCNKIEDQDETQDPEDPLERLWNAIHAGETVQQLVHKILSVRDVNMPVGGGGGTCAHAAASRGHVVALHLLHARGANLDAGDAAARTPLMHALIALLEKPINKTSEKASKPPTKDTSDMEVDESLVETSEKDESVEEVKEDVNKASDEELMKVIRYLVAAGCDVNFPGPEGMTALHLAAQHGDAEVCRVILSAGSALVDPRDHGGWTPLVWAAENKHSDVVSVLLTEGADAATSDSEGNACVHWCALGGDARALHALLQAAPHATHLLNAHRDTPLHVAARQGHYACVVVLLARGARTDIKNGEGDLPVDVCIGQCKSAIWLNMQMCTAVAEPDAPQYRLLSSDISNGRERLPVPCVNDVDSAPLPDEFTYVVAHVTPDVLPIDNTIDTLQGCQCVGEECASSTCACCALGVRRWWTRGRLVPDFPYHEPPMIFECNQTCRCNQKKCNNSVLTRASAGGSTLVRAQVFRTRGGARGWGLRAVSAVPRGTPVATYCGELLTAHVADTRPTDHYMFALDLKQDLLEQCSEKTQLCVDAARFGSAARFINHSCAPNLAPVRVFTATRDLRVPTVALFAIKDIAVGEEFTFDYGDKFWSVKSKFMKCECGSVECRYPAKTDESDI